MQNRLKELVGKDFAVEVTHKTKYRTTKTKPSSNEIKISFPYGGLPPE